MSPLIVPAPRWWELPDISGLRGQGLPGIDAEATLAVMSVLPGVLRDDRAKCGHERMSVEADP